MSRDKQPASNADPSLKSKQPYAAVVCDRYGQGQACSPIYNLDMLGVFAEFETNLRRERQLEGVRVAKERGISKGRKLRIDAAAVRRLREEQKLRPIAIARRLGIGRASVDRVLAMY